MIAHEQHAISGTGTRLDRHLLSTYPWLDRTTVQELIAAGAITRNGSRSPKGAKLSAGDVLDCRDIPEPDDLRLRPNSDLPLNVLYEDAALLALDKPAGQPTHPLRATETDTLANALVARFPELASIGDDRLFPALLHRLDTQTSGLVLAAKTPAAYAALRAQFRRFTVKKHYTALVHGRVDSPGRLDAPLTHQTRSPCTMAVVRHLDKVKASDRFDAVTAWSPIQTGKEFSLLDVVIFTGVTHQIRCHLAAAGHPIAGDALYGSAILPPVSSLQSPVSGLRPLPPRHWLHAARIILTHPATAKSLDLACPLPPDWPPVRSCPIVRPS
ncbi:MAG: RluA family pseudouridine synthase [Opitutae bacterium]|nr:RluA family pseudouridine synthase [Opitutae bacterium]